MYTYLTVYGLSLLANSAAVKHLYTFIHKLVAVRSVDLLLIIGAPVWRWLCEYVTLDRTFYSKFIPFKQEAVAVQLLPHFLPLRVLEEALTGNIM